MAATDEEGWLVLIGGRCTDSSILSRLKSQTFHTPRHLDTWKQRSQRPPSLCDTRYPAFTDNDYNPANYLSRYSQQPAAQSNRQIATWQW